MKKILFLFSAVFFLDFLSFAQAPQGINYQGVARDNTGSAISKQNIGVQISIFQSSTAVYRERQTVQTDTFGLYTLVIGDPTAVVLQGSFATIPWASGNMSAKIDIDPTGGTTYTTVATVTLQSVPYALYAASSGNSSNGTVTSITSGAGLTSSPNPIVGAGTIDLPTFAGVQGTYGSSTMIPSITVDAYGRVTSASQTLSTSVPAFTTVSPALSSTVTGNSINVAANNGSAIWNAGSIQGIGVSATAPLTNDVLQYNGTQWMPAPSALSGGSNGQVFVNNGGTWGGSTISNLNFTNNMLGIGTATPAGMLDAVSTSSVAAVRASNAGGAGPAIISNGPLKLNGTILDGAAIPGSNGDVLISQGAGSAPKWLNPSSLSPWTLSGTNIFPTTLTNNVGIGTNSPAASLDIANVAGASNPAINIFNNGTSYGINIQNSANSLSGLKIYHPATGSAAYISGQNKTNNSDILYVETNGPGNAIKGYTDSTGSAIFGYNHSASTGGAGIYGYSDNMGSAGIFHVYNNANFTAALDVMTQGSGYSGVFSGGAGVQVDQIQITGGSPALGYVLTSDAIGNASWQAPSSAGGLPPVQQGSLLFGINSTNWAATNPAQVSSDGNSITVVNTTTVGTAGTFITNNSSAASVPALLATSNSSTGYAIQAINNSGAAILANSGGPYVLTANLSAGNGNGVEGNLVNGSNGKGIVGWLDNSSTGNAGYFENTNGSNNAAVLHVLNSGASTGKSAIFSGGTGVQIDNLQIQTNLNVAPGANSGFVLTSDATGNATWQALPGGVATVGTNAPLVNSGTPSNPVLGLQSSGVIAASYGTATSVPQLSVDIYGRITSAGNVAISGVPPAGGAGGDLTGTYPNPSLVNTGVTANTYGSATAVPTLIIDAKGRITNAGTIVGSSFISSSGGWLTTGNALGATGILGTSTAQDIIIRTSNADRMTFKSGGSIGVNQPAPVFLFDLLSSNASGGMNVAHNASAGPALNVQSSAATNAAPALNVSSSSSTGFSGKFTGGVGLSTDKFQMTSGGPTNGAVMIASNVAGDAIWAGAVNFSAQGGTTTVASGGGGTAITFGTTAYNTPAAAFNGTTFTAQSIGVHHFDAAVSVNVGTALVGAQDYVVRLVCSNGVTREASVHLPNGYAGVVQNQLGADFQMAAGQTVQVVVFHTAGQNLTVIGGAQATQTYFNGHIVH